MTSPSPPPYEPSDELANHRTYEQRSFWAQKVFSSLLLGHGAALLALVAGFASAEDPASVIEWVRWPANLFAAGLCISYAIAVLMWLGRGGWDHDKGERKRFNKAAVILSGTSASLFALGVILGLVGLWTAEPAAKDAPPVQPPVAAAPNEAAISAAPEKAAPPPRVALPASTPAR